MLRPRGQHRRPSSSSASYECSALPSFAEYIQPDVPYMDHSASSCFEEDEDECPIIQEVKSFHPDYLLKPHQQQSSSSSWSGLFGRLLAVVCAFVLIGCRLKTVIVQKSDVGLFDGPTSTSVQPSSLSATTTTMTTTATVTPIIATTTTTPPTSTTTMAGTNSMASLTDEQLEKQALLFAKYGKGPYLIEFQLSIWGDDNRPVEHYFTIELAPSDLLPATVYFFLEQVSKGLWSETSFYENLEHVIVSRPVSGNGQVSKRQQFVDTGLSRPSLAEYSPHYFPHSPYTLGLSDNDNGGVGGDNVMTFYINKRHNVHHHHRNEPCFAQVVVGRATIDQLANLPGSDTGRIRPVEIKQVRRIQLTDLSPRAVQEYALVKSSR